MRRIYKYATGAVVPERAKYLSTVTQTRIERPAQEVTEMRPDGTWEDHTVLRGGGWQDCWLVWHYYEVEE